MSKSGQEVYADTISAVNFNNGVVKLVLVGQDMSDFAKEENNKDPVMEHKKTLVMPLAGFLYALSVMQGLCNEEKMKTIIEKYEKADLLQSEKSEKS